MATFKKILLCYDSTPEGQRALRQGAELAVKLGAVTHLLAIVAGEVTALEDAMISATMVGSGSAMLGVAKRHKIASALLEDGVKRLQKLGLAASGHLAFGNAIDEIVAAARELEVDLVVVGHKTRGGLARWWAGPGETRLLDLVGCSVLVSIVPAGSIESP